MKFMQLMNKIKKKLSLDICKDNKINIDIPVSVNEDKIFKYNSSNDYYNDPCLSYTIEDQTDIIIKDRRDEFNNDKLSLCEKDCEFKGYDSVNKKALCECFIKFKFPLISEVAIDKNQLLNNFKDLSKTLNLSIMKCIKNVFSNEGIKKNIGFYILLIVIVISIALSIFFIIKGFNELNNKINEIVKIKLEKETIMNSNNNNNNSNNIKFQNNINKNIEKESAFINNNKKVKKKIKKKKIKKIKVNRNKTFNNLASLDKSVNKLNIKNLVQENKQLNDNNNNILTNDANHKIIVYNDYEYNNLTYKEALSCDKRTFIQYYISLIKRNHLLIFTFYTSGDYNSRILKIMLFLFSFALYLTINALFFSDSTMHKIYQDKGKFNFIYQIPQILYSSIFSSIISIIVKLLSLSKQNILEIKNVKKDVEQKASQILKFLIIKFVFFFEICFMFLLVFWYYLSCFGAVYRNTQIYLIKDTLISYGLSLIYPFGLNALPCAFRIIALKNPQKNKELIYKISLILQKI